MIDRSLEIALTSDNYLKVSNIHRADERAITSITGVTARLLNSAGTAVTGSSITLTVVTGEADAYDGIYASTITLTKGAQYTVEVTINADGLKRTLTETVTAV